MRWDERYYPDPKAMIDRLHAMNVEFMVSVWSKIDPESEVGKQFTAKGYYIPGTEWIDFFNPAAASLYWKNFSERMLSLGIDAWWLDATEPENDDLDGRSTFAGPGDKVRDIYPLFVNKTVYEGQRKDAPTKRVLLLTRCAFFGQQRYAAATWSGDIGNSWDPLRGKSQPDLVTPRVDSHTGLRTLAGFFVRVQVNIPIPPIASGSCGGSSLQPFPPLQRVHGYQTDTEAWRYGDQVEGEVRRYLDLRQQLLPYIYSQAAAVTFEGSTLMRPLVMDFAHDDKALAQKYEYMFGPAFLISPVLETGAVSWPVYTPATLGGWYNFWTGSRVQPGTDRNRRSA